MPGGRQVAEVSDSEPRHGTEDPRLGTYIEEIVLLLSSQPSIKVHNVHDQRLCCMLV